MSDEIDSSSQQLSSLKALWANESETTPASSNVSSIWNPLSQVPPLSGSTHKQTSAHEAPKVLTVEELEKKLGAQNITEDWHEEDASSGASDQLSEKSTLSINTNNVYELDALSEVSHINDITSPIVVSPIHPSYQPGPRAPMMLPRYYPVPFPAQPSRPPLMPFPSTMPPPPLHHPHHLPPGIHYPYRSRLPLPPPHFMWPPPPRHFLAEPMPVPLGHGGLYPLAHPMMIPNANWDGFMTQREKEWVLKVQFMQLQSKDASVDDYYYQNHLMRKKTYDSFNDKETQVNEVKLLLPAVTREEKVYQPTEFKDSLGKLKVFSVSNPRQSIDVGVGIESESGDRLANSKDVARKRKVQLAVIEKTYQLVLDIEDCDKKALAIPEQDRPTFLSSKAQMVSAVYRHFKLKELSDTWKKNDDSFFKELMYYRKGKRLVNRLLPLLSQEEAIVVVFSFLRNITALIRRDEKEEGTQVLAELTNNFCSIVENCSTPTLNRLLMALLRGPPQAHPHIPAVVMAAKSKFCGPILVKIVTRGQAFYNDSLTDSSSVGQWNELISELAGSLTSKLESIPDNIVDDFASQDVHLRSNTLTQSEI